MTVQEYDEKISLAKSQFSALKLNLDALFLQVQTASITFIKDQAKKMIENNISGNPEITNKLEIENLKEIKTAMNDTINQADTNVPTYFDKLKVIYHNDMKFVKDGDVFGQEYNIPKNIESKVTNAFRKLLSPIGEVLVKYKYEKLGGAWKKDYSQNSLVEYAYSFYLGEDLAKILKTYSEKCRDAFKILAEIDMLEKERERQKAKNLWDQI